MTTLTILRALAGRRSEGGDRGMSERLAQLAPFLNEGVADDALAMIKMLGVTPLIGADDDGSASFTFVLDMHHCIGSMNIQGDGTCCYYVENAKGHVASGECEISEPLPAGLRRTLHD